jgi:hypothetical protein
MIKFIVIGMLALLCLAFAFPSVLQMGRAVGREVEGALDDVTEDEDEQGPEEKD